MRFMGFPELREVSADIVHRARLLPGDMINRALMEGQARLKA